MTPNHIERGLRVPRCAPREDESAQRIHVHRDAMKQVCATLHLQFATLCITITHAAGSNDAAGRLL